MSDFFNKCLDYLTHIFKTFAPFMGLLLLSFQEISNIIGFLTIQMGLKFAEYLGFDTDFSDVATIDWAVVNTLFPVSEVWAMIVAYMSFMSAILLFRWSKSIVPMIAN